MRGTKKITVTALLSAMAVAVLSLGSLIGTLDLTAAALASFLVVLLHVEMGKRWAVLYWAVTSALALLLMPQSSAALFFAAAGLYPLLKASLERLSRLWEWGLKLAAFWGMLAVYILLAKFVFLLPDAALSGWMLWALVATATAAFVLYDLALSRLVIYYGLRLRHRISRFFH